MICEKKIVTDYSFFAVTDF